MIELRRYPRPSINIPMLRHHHNQGRADAFKEELLAPLDQERDHTLGEAALRAWTLRQQGVPH